MKTQGSMNLEQKTKKNQRDRSRDKDKAGKKSITENFPKITVKIKSIDNTMNILLNKVNELKNQKNQMNQNIPIEKCIDMFTDDTLKLLENDKSLESTKIQEDIIRNISPTQKELQDKYTNKLIGLIQGLKKTNIYAELPLLPYGNSLSDDDFIALLEKCVLYANFNFEENRIKDIQKRLLNDFPQVLKDVFKGVPVIKDLIENSLLTILTSDKENEQEDNFQLLKTRNFTATPLIKMSFGQNESLDKNELIKTFSSYVYLKNYKKVLKQFIPNNKEIVKSEKEIKKYIAYYFNNHYIYFCDLPENILATIIHSGNMYLKSSYLYEYYNEKSEENLLIIREKIILNIGHELMHALLREISCEMKSNFLLKSNPKNTETKNSDIQFRDKYDTSFHLLDKNESGNTLDFHFFNGYYFGELFASEAKLFSNIKKIKTLKDYRAKLETVINNDKNKNLMSGPVNKFKKLEMPVKRCFRSRIYKKIKVTEEEYKKFELDLDSEEESED